MNTIKISSKKTKIIAHRGLSGIEPENTIAAFIAAGNRSYYGIETDLHVTKDGKYVTIHDENTERVGDTNIVIAETTLEQLRKIHLFSDYSPATRPDLVIPEFSEYLTICKHYKKFAIIELKAHFTQEQINEIISIIKKYDYLKSTVFISFDFENLVKVRNTIPKQKVQFLVKKFTLELIERLVKHKMDLDIYFRSLTKRRVQLCHKNGIKVNCWTVNMPFDAARLINYGVDFITTNILE